MSINPKRQICSYVSSLFDLVPKKIGKRVELRILMYHSIGDTLKNDRYGMTISIESFGNQISIVSKDDKVQIISLKSKNFDSLWSEKNGKMKIAITFDDGYRDNLYAVAPVLLKWGIPFTVFVTSGFLQNNSNVYLSKEDLRELSGLPGVTIGSHGMTHARLSGLSDYELYAELADSRSRIEDIIGKKVDMLSYPHGKVDRRVRDAAVKSGYRLGFGSRFGVNFENSDPMVLRRTEVWSGDSKDVFRQKYSGAWDWYGYYQKLRGL